MANRYPKNARFYNITVSNDGNGSLDSDVINSDTIYVKNLVVTNNLRIPVSNLDNLNPEDKTLVRINREYTPIAKESGLLYLDSYDGNMKVQKDGDIVQVSDPGQAVNVETVQTYTTTDYTDFIVNNDNKFSNIYQDIEFKGEQQPLTKDYILGSTNNINFRNDDSNYYIFDGYVVANVKKPSSGTFTSATYSDSDQRLKMYQPKFSAFNIESGLIRLQDDNINRYSINTVCDGINGIEFQMIKLNIGNKNYLSISCTNSNSNYVTWSAKIRLYKINVVHTNDNEKPYKLTNEPTSDIDTWNGYSIDDSEIYFEYSSHIDFFSIPIYNQAYKDNVSVPNSIFKKYISSKKCKVIDTNNNELLYLNNSEYLTYNMSDEIAKFKKNSNKYNYILGNKTLVVRDGLLNSNLAVPYIYKDTLYYFYNNTKQELNNFNLNNGFWKKKVEYSDETSEYIDKVFTTTKEKNDQLIEYSYLEENLNNYFDLYQFSIKEIFKTRKPIDVSAYDSKKFIKKNNNIHYFIYKKLGFFNTDFTELFMDNNNTNYYFDFGSINILNGYAVINDYSKNYNYSYKIQGYFYIPNFQEIRSDLIDKIVTKKLKPQDINDYINNTFCNICYFKVEAKKILDNDILNITDTSTNKYIKPVKNISDEARHEIQFDFKVVPDNIVTTITEDDDYATIAKKLISIQTFKLNICMKYHTNSDLFVNVFIKNNIFNVFSI